MSPEQALQAARSDWKREDETIIRINHEFDAGNIEVESLSDAGDVSLRIRQDSNSHFYQWFYFELAGAAHTPCRLRLLNAGGAAYPGGFENYRVLYSYDQDEWLRHETRLHNGVLSVDFTPARDSVFFAYFVPFSLSRHRQLIERAALSPLCSHRVLGQTLDGHDLDLLVVDSSPGDASPDRHSCWIIARQHPGETMAEWWMEGCLEHLLSDQPLARQLLAQCRVYLIPNMNPDGAVRGNLRCNAAGRNLNREWVEPSMQASPEVFLVKQEIARSGADFFLDVHGDEALPYCFIAGTEGLAQWDEQRQAQLDFYRDTLARINPDFQTAVGYPPKPRGQANLSMSTAQTADLHGCLAMTLEMPFKDTTATPDPRYGWSTARSKALAHSCLEALTAYLASGLLSEGS